MRINFIKILALKYYFIVIYLYSTASVSFSQTNTDLIKIVADDRAEGDCFGWSTSIYGNYCVVGTPEKKAKAPFGNRLWEEGGGAYIFAKQKKGNWLQTQMLLPDKPKECDFFGTSVSMYDNYLAIGCNGDDTINKNSHFLNRMGAVYMYKLDKLGKWNKTQKIILEKRELADNFGDKVCLYKKKLAISSSQKEFPNSKYKGAVYIYEQTGSGGWIQKHIIKCLEKDVVLFGKNLSISDSLIIIGCESENAFVYKLSNNGQWNLLQKLSKIDKSDASFGSSVSIKNNLILVGANGNYENYDDNLDTLAFRKNHLLGAGSVYIYEIDAKDNINFKQRITAKDIKADMHFGMCMSITDSFLVVGAFGDALDIDNLPNNRYGGATYIFKQNNVGEWVETKKIVAPKRSIWDKFAFSVSTYNKTVIIGSRFEKENAQEKSPILNAGAAYIYEDK
jgi:hypothetical protein